jgi:hypothetical protein
VFASTLTSKHKITMREIYAILQNLFRFVTISRTQQSPLAGAHGIGVNDLTSVDSTRALHDLRDEIHAKDKQICNYQQIIQEAERSVGELTLIIREKGQDIRESHEPLSQADHAIVEMMEQQLELNCWREREIIELTIAIKGLEQEIAKQKAEIAVLESQLQRPFTAPDHRLLKEISSPPNWSVVGVALIRIGEGSSFLFSIATFDRFLSISSVQDIVWALTMEFEDFSQFPGKEWQLMAILVLYMVFNGAVYDENSANLEETRRLRSMREQLTRGCRTLRKDSENDLLQCQILMRQLRSRFADQEQQILTQSREMDWLCIILWCPITISRKKDGFL